MLELGEVFLLLAILQRLPQRRPHLTKLLPGQHMPSGCTRQGYGSIAAHLCI